ncbi:MAG: TonB-dependent receptor [Gammaproteobacteria bacterium]|nr:TonB-dependent receptor [Gammaproteobacteria bacterium]
MRFCLFRPCRTHASTRLLAASIGSAIAVPAFAAEQERADPNAVEEIVVVGDLGSMPGEDVQTVFGFGKSLVRTPRSVSTVTDEMIDRFNMRDIDELIALAPGSFTQSFFGVAGSLDIRGTPGETYFRGVRRLDNPGNYPTPIGASDRVDIVRGPASPIHGPAKIGGYLNFKPKSARIEETGQFIADRTGAIGLDLGSWDKRIVSAEAGGPGSLGGQDFGYYFYGEVEDSGSFYRDTDMQQTLLQASFDTDLSARLELQFGGMFHDHSSNQVAGWNRLTQELVDRGTCLTGQPTPLDANGDGRISHQEFDVNGDGFTDLNPFAAGLVPGTGSALNPEGPFPGACFIGETAVFGCRPDLLALANTGTTTLDMSEVLTWPDDVLEAEVLTLYLDAIFDADSGWEWTNQLFYESYDTLAESGYGFSQFHDTSVIEDRFVVVKEFRLDTASVAVQASPSARFTRFRHADDYTNEYFDRRDLSRPPSARDTRLLATEIDDDYTEYYIGDYLDLGIAALASIDWELGLGLLAGVRYDSIDMESRQPIDKLLLPSSNNFCLPPGDCVDEQASATVDGVSWTLSLSYALPGGVVPYLTASEQATVIAGQGGEISTTNIAEGGAFDTSRLREAGVKGELIDGGLYFALATYVQERTDFSAQAIVTNQATETEGIEFEVRWVATERLLLTLGYSRIEVVNLNTLESGSRFSFIGADDVPGIAPEALYGGALGGVLVRPGAQGARRAGIPENILSLTGTYDFGNGFAVSASVVDADSVHAGFSGSVTLPAYTLVNVGMVFETERWSFSATLKNATDERYFRSNFPNLFGGVIVLPELPRHMQARLRYRW